MITVNGKILEVGDKVIFRNTGYAYVNEIEAYGKELIVYLSDMNGRGYTYNSDGSFTRAGTHLLDIIDIKKAEKPKISTYRLQLNRSLKGGITTNIDNGSYPIGDIVVNVCNHKILSVEVCDE